MGVLPLFVHKHQNERQREQSQDASCYGQGHWHSAWGSNRETELKKEKGITGRPSLGDEAQNKVMYLQMVWDPRRCNLGIHFSLERKNKYIISNIEYIICMAC